MKPFIYADTGHVPWYPEPGSLFLQPKGKTVSSPWSPCASSTFSQGQRGVCVSSVFPVSVGGIGKIKGCLLEYEKRGIIQASRGTATKNRAARD